MVKVHESTNPSVNATLVLTVTFSPFDSATNAAYTGGTQTSPSYPAKAA
jgi:hypothetical protein